MNDNSDPRFPYPRYLTVPFVFVPDGAPAPPELTAFKAANPGWMTIRATFTLRGDTILEVEPAEWAESELRETSPSPDYSDVDHATPMQASPSYPGPSPYGTSKAEAQAKFEAACWAAHDQTTDAALNREQPETPREAATSTHQGDVQAGPAAAASAGHAAQPAPPDPLIATPEEMRAFHDWLAARSNGAATRDSSSYQDQPVIGSVTHVSDVGGPAPSEVGADSPSTADGTPTAPPPVSVARQPAPIYGTAQNTTGTQGDLHAGQSLNIARKFAADPRIAAVYINRSLRTITGDKTVPNVRFDVTAVGYPDSDGVTPIYAVEIMSPNQTVAGLEKKMESAGDRLPKRYRLATDDVLGPAPEIQVKGPDFVPDLDIPDFLIP